MTHDRSFNIDEVMVLQKQSGFLAHHIYIYTVSKKNAYTNIIRIIYNKWRTILTKLGGYVGGPILHKRTKFQRILSTNNKDIDIRRAGVSDITNSIMLYEGSVKISSQSLPLFLIFATLKIRYIL